MGFALPNPTRSLIFFKAYMDAPQLYEPVGINVGDLGHECDRALWHNFRRRVAARIWSRAENWRIFDTGDHRRKAHPG